jgi:hypothetical protein
MPQGPRLCSRLQQRHRRGQRAKAGRLVPTATREAWRGRGPCPAPALRAAPVLGGAAPAVALGFARGSLEVARVNQRWWALSPLCAAGLAPYPAWRAHGAWAGSQLSAVFRSLGGLLTLKIRYKGKSFRWHRKRGALLLRFGHSHVVCCYLQPGLRWRRFGRMKILLYGTSANELRQDARRICAWRAPNIYHGRGLRLSRQRLCRKAGKVSLYR